MDQKCNAPPKMAYVTNVYSTILQHITHLYIFTNIILPLRQTKAKDMVLNFIWIAFFLVGFAVLLLRVLLGGDPMLFSTAVSSTFDMAKTGFEISIGLTGILTMWLGLMRIGDKAGMVQFLSRMVQPIFKHLFKGVPANHPAMGSMVLNISANMLGLDNAATPMGLKAMKELQELNEDKETASDAMIMFMVLNTSGLTIIPISIMMYRAQMGAANPSDVFLPILIATFFSTIAGLIAVSIYQRINLLKPAILLFFAASTLIIGGSLFALNMMPMATIQTYSLFIGNFILLATISGFILMGAIKKLNVYETFIEGAKEGFQMAIGIVPYLIAILVAIGIFRSSGAMDFLIDGIKWMVGLTGLDTQFVAALPTALMKPLSGSGARGLMIETMNTFGPDSFEARLASIVQGSTDTTFYILAVYFGSVGVRKTKYALTAGLIADFVGIVTAIIMGYLFFG